MNSENVYSAFAALMSQSKSGFTTVSRRLILVEDCDPSLMPALYIKEQTRKIRDRSSDGVETWLLNLDLFIYVSAPDDTTPASPIFNPLIDWVCNALPPITLPLPETTDGVQYNPFVSGDITMFEGWLGTKSVVHIPIAIIAPDNA